MGNIGLFLEETSSLPYFCVGCKNAINKKIMNRFLLLIFGLSFGLQTGISQNNSQLDDNYFLGIDPNQPFEQYGHDPASLSGDLNPFPLVAFSRESHEFSDIDFDSEIILFNQAGLLDGFVFSKLFSQEQYGSSNKSKAADLYKLLKQRLQDSYGTPGNEEPTSATWSTGNYDLRLVLNRETSVQLHADLITSPGGRPTFVEEPFDIEINEKTFTIRSIEDLDAAVVELFNAYLGALNEELVRSFARKNGSRLDIFFEREVDLRPEEKQGEIKEAAKVLEQTLITTYAEQVLLNVFDQPNDLDLLRTIQVDRLNFILDMFYGDGSETRSHKSVTVEELETLQFPMSRRDARSLLRDE